MFKFFNKEQKPENIKEILAYLEKIEEKLEKLKKGLGDLKEKSGFFIQKAEIIRYNPFSEVGSDQSFSIALLDGNNDGVVITGLFTREGNRVYAKPIKNKQSEYSLSDEEKKVIDKAISPKSQ